MKVFTCTIRKSSFFVNTSAQQVGSIYRCLPYYGVFKVPFDIIMENILTSCWKIKSVLIVSFFKFDCVQKRLNLVHITLTRCPKMLGLPILDFFVKKFGLYIELCFRILLWIDVFDVWSVKVFFFKLNVRIEHIQCFHDSLLSRIVNFSSGLVFCPFSSKQVGFNRESKINLVCIAREKTFLDWCLFAWVHLTLNYWLFVVSAGCQWWPACFVAVSRINSTCTKPWALVA